MFDSLTPEEKEAILNLTSIYAAHIIQELSTIPKWVDEYMQTYGRREIDCLNDFVQDKMEEVVENVMFLDMDNLSPDEMVTIFDSRAVLGFPEYKTDWEAQKRREAIRQWINKQENQAVKNLFKKDVFED